MAANVAKSPLIRFVDELDFKQIPVSVKRKKKEECPSGLILIDSNCQLKRVESSSESSSGEEDELDGGNNSDEDQTSSSCSESGEISKSGEAREKGRPRATTSVKKSCKKRKALRNILSEEEVEELCERLEKKRHDLDCEIARKLKSSPNLAFYPSRAALKEAILGDKNVLNEINDEFVNEFIGVIHDVYHTKMTATDKKGCIVDKLVKFMGICYLNQFHGFINIQVRASEINIKSPNKINSMLSGNADNEVSRS